MRTPSFYLRGAAQEPSGATSLSQAPEDWSGVSQMKTMECPPTSCVCEVTAPPTVCQICELQKRLSVTTPALKVHF